VIALLCTWSIQAEGYISDNSDVSTPRSTPKLKTNRSDKGKSKKRRGRPKRPHDKVPLIIESDDESEIVTPDYAVSPASSYNSSQVPSPASFSSGRKRHSQ